MTTKARTKLTFSPFVSHPLDFLLSYISFHVNNFCLLSTRLKNIAFALQLIHQILRYFGRSQRRGYMYLGQKGILSNGQLFFFTILKWLVWPVKSKRARGKNVEPIFTHFAFFSVVLILLAVLRFEAKHNSVGQRSHFYLFNLTFFNCCNNLTLFLSETRLFSNTENVKYWINNSNCVHVSVRHKRSPC